MANDEEIGFPGGRADERELFLAWLGFLRTAVIRKTAGLSDAEARWRPDGHLISLLGIVSHLTGVERRWIDGGFLGKPTIRDEAEFHPGDELNLDQVCAEYRQRAAETDAFVRAARTLALPCQLEEGTDLRWVLLHLINETARHAGHADAVRELLDGTTGE